jgi:hypothetical protein
MVATSVEAPASPSASHVRAVSEFARQSIADGVARSSTIVRLIAALNASDVIVFVDSRVDPAITTAQTSLMTSTKTVRYVHVVLNPRLSTDARLEYLGHELQHALEISADRSAVDGASVRRLFAAIGRELAGSTHQSKSYETEDARLVSAAVRREIGRPLHTATAGRVR